MINYDKIEYIYARNYNYFFVVAFNVCEDRELAKDIVQDGFIGILGSAEVFADTAHARRYLTGCIKNAAFARLTKERRIKAMRHDFIVSDKREETLCHKLRGLVAKLKCPTTRTIIQDLYFNGKTRTELATLYEIDRHTISAKEQKGLKQLKLILK